MLKNIPAIISPELLKILSEMGHGDEIVLADANYPAASTAKKLVRYDGIDMKQILPAILEVLPIDIYVESGITLMETTNGDNTPDIWVDYQNIVNEKQAENKKISHIEREAFYERGKKAYAVVATGETALYANIILKKGVIVAS
ncbi:L-fucose mutarotase [Granulicatella balaenopterae]|uniref:L-fucose mutarotase n=1 Tax=Granulicatella balaenopterae TaxID=137733 RepID=A0A1H9J2B7_9LACT|nr:RbsD/FucU domain-containing protein [Granulicatella balaenopterae]SEQ80755.1 L-fucose mutarotase [Granulicatella balaenopterae]